MRNCYRSIFIQKKLGNRKTDYVAPADYDRALALYPDTGSLEHLNYALRGAWKHTILFLPKRRNIQRVEAVHVFFLGNCLYHLGLADMLRKRKLHEDAVNGIVFIEFPYKREQLFFRYSLRFAYGRVLYPYRFRSLGLSCHI